MQKKFIFISGGVCSSLGKGIASASIGMLLEKHGIHIAFLKLDPYLNVDPGTMNPFQHGEVYVTDDGAETDLDLGHYHRFSNSPLSRASNATSGQIYHTVIQRERKGEYLGNTVQVIPHITEEIKRRIQECADQSPETEVVIVEIGGTVGDIESQPFMEAIRQFNTAHPKNCLDVHLTYVPFLNAAGEFKTKPTQHSVQILRSMGLVPDMILCRCERPLPEEVKSKIALFGSVKSEAVIEVVDVEHSIYEVPLELYHQGLDHMILKRLDLPERDINLDVWEEMLRKLKNPKDTITIGIVGKYVLHQDAYKSIFEALYHAGLDHQIKVNIRRIESDKVTPEKMKTPQFQECDGFLVPGGFGDRGFAGKLLTAQYCRENKTPYFGICLGMQVMAVEFAKNVLGYEEATSTEMDPKTPYPIISLMNEQYEVVDKGGTMRLGAYACTLKPDSLARKVYGMPEVQERHRHRYEFNSKFEEEMEKAGFIVSGKLKNQNLCEIAEIENHPWMIGVQFHPEFLSKPTHPHPLFSSFIQAIIHQKQTQSPV